MINIKREEFINDAKDKFDNSDVVIFDPKLARAIGLMLGHVTDKGKPSLEAVGVAKVLAVSAELDEFYKKLESEGRKKFKFSEAYEYVKDILLA